MPHYQIDGAAAGPTHKAPERVPAHAERQRGMMIVVERAEALVTADAESESLRDALNGQFAQLLKIKLIYHMVKSSSIPRSWSRAPSGRSR